MTRSDPWKKLQVGEAKRVDKSGQFDFFWVILEDDMLGLMLRLPDLPNPLPRLPKLKNILTSFRTAGDGKAFVLGLKERNQSEIFETLCVDVIECAERAKNREAALSMTLQRTKRWHYLLRGGKTGGLTVEEQRGLVGELAFLRDLVTELGPRTAIEAWTGPSGSAKDFELINSCIEVKGHRAAANPSISISSENQLADVEGARVFLRISSIASAVLPDGESLHDHVKKTQKLFEEDSAAFDTWEMVLYSTGYDPENSYDNRRWVLGANHDYEVVDGFPRITSPLIQGVANVRYSIDLNACEPFKLEDNLTKLIKLGIKNE